MVHDMTKKAVVAVDSFKGSLTSMEAGEAVKRGILRAWPDAEVTVLPLADGGEGTVDSIAPFINGITRTVPVSDPLGRQIEASYIFDPESRTAYIEMAKAAGLTLLKEDEHDPYLTTTYGVGELMKDAIDNGAGKLVICIGGSATNDGGAGMLQALGARLLDKDGNDVRPGAIGLKDLYKADFSSLLGRGIQVITASDVTNPLCGPDGASFVYGPQKGASKEACEAMDGWLKNFAELSGFDPFEKGTGAAGGMSFALKNFLGAELRSGAKIVMEITGLEDLIRECDIVVTGEGRIDSQTLNGKAPFMVMEAGRKYGKPVIGICGITGEGYEKCLKAGFTKIVPLIHPVMETSGAVISVEETVEKLFVQASDRTF
jgi:glycerate kinase